MMPPTTGTTRRRNQGRITVSTPSSTTTATTVDSLGTTVNQRQQSRDNLAASADDSSVVLRAKVPHTSYDFAAVVTPSSAKHPLVSALGPLSLLGGTAALYASVLRHPSSTLTPLSLMYMILLALQYTVQPRLSRKYMSPKTNKKAVALAEEVVKTAMATAIFVQRQRTSAVSTEAVMWTLSSSFTVAGLPAVLYAIQGVMQYTSHQYLDPVTFNGLTQMKTLSAALFCFLVIGKRQSYLQMAALLLLLGSALLFQGYGLGMILSNNNNSSKKKDEEKHSDAANKQPDDWFVLGVMPCLAATLLSGLAGALSQKGLQWTGGTGRDPFLYTMEISFFSAMTLVLDMVWNKQRKTTETEKPTQQTRILEDWTWRTWIPIVCKAAGGVLTALVHKHAGSVAKGFALLAGLVMSGLAQSFLRDERILPHQTIGTLLCLFSSWLHFTHPPAPPV